MEILGTFLLYIIPFSVGAYVIGFFIGLLIKAFVLACIDAGKKKNEFDKMQNDTNEKIQTQKQYCSKHNAPFVAPLTDNSWCCGRNIWSEITLERAGSELITSCPICHRSFVD